MDFSLGFLIPLGDDKKKTPEQELKAQVSHFETLERRKLTKKEVAEIGQAIQSKKENEKNQKNARNLLLSLFLVVFLICFGVFIVLVMQANGNL